MHLGKFVFPDRATYLSITNRTELEQNRSAGICLETPYWFKYDIATDQCEVDFCTEEDAQERINALPRQQVPQCVIFAKYAFTAGSFGDTLYKSGALAFMEDKMRNFSLYKLRDSPLPSKANPSNEVIRELQECFKDVLSLCDELNDD